MSSNSIRAYFEANKRLVAETKEMPVLIANTFLAAALYEDVLHPNGDPMTLEDLAVRNGIVPTTISTHLAYLGEFYRRGKPGLGLVATHEFSGNRRRKTFELTPKGRRLIGQLELIFKRMG